MNKRYRLNSRRYFFLLLLFFHVVILNAQHNTLEGKKYSVEFQIFANTSFNNETSQQLKFEYDIKRTLIIYRQHLSKKFNFCLAGDTYGKNNEKPYNRTPYLKRAYLQYHNQVLSISAGLIVLEQFKYQRKIWQLRYIDKTFQNKFKYGKNRNIGILLKHNLSSRFSYDLAITTGYSTPVKNSSKKYQLMMGQTFNTGFCSFRLFNSISLKPDYEHILSLFITKEIRKSKLGIEVAKKSSNNKEMNKYGFSVFGNHLFYKNIMIFARYDMNKESIKPQTKYVIWAGIQYSFKKYISTSIFYKSENLETNFYGLAIFIN
jgi:hypothetical protein